MSKYLQVIILLATFVAISHGQNYLTINEGNYIISPSQGPGDALKHTHKKTAETVDAGYFMEDVVTQKYENKPDFHWTIKKSDIKPRDGSPAYQIYLKSLPDSRDKSTLYLNRVGAYTSPETYQFVASGKNFILKAIFGSDERCLTANGPGKNMSKTPCNNKPDQTWILKRI